MSDKIRDRLAEMGIKIKDGTQQCRFKRLVEWY